MGVPALPRVCTTDVPYDYYLELLGCVLWVYQPPPPPRVCTTGVPYDYYLELLGCVLWVYQLLPGSVLQVCQVPRLHWSEQPAELILLQNLK